MSRREDVISHLRIMHTWATVDGESGRGMNTESCARIAEWTMDALDLIDAKPRVMTKDEVMALKEGEVAWLEERFEKAGKRFISPTMSDGKGQMMGAYAHLSVAVMHSRGRRFWTARPTEEQMEATAWNN